MALKKIVNLQCDVCATEIVISTFGEYRLEPIYCCGLEVIESSPKAKKKRVATKALKGKGSTRKKTAKVKKKAAPKKRTVQKSAAKRKPVPKPAGKKKKAAKKAARKK